MSEELTAVARFALSIASIGLLLFTVGALAGWRWASPRLRHEPTWIFVTGQVAWGMLLLSLILSPTPDGFEWLRWLTAVAIVCSVIALALQLRARAADRSGGGETP